MEVVWEAVKRRRLTVALKISFDHCAGRRSSNASAFRPERDDQIGDGSRSSGVVSRYGPIQVAVSRMYSTCVSPWRVPLMNVTAESSGQSPWAPTILRAEAVLHRHHGRAVELPFDALRE